MAKKKAAQAPGANTAVKITVVAPPDLAAQLARVAKAERRSLSAQAVIALSEWLAQRAE
jgi:hypothetical protein